MKERTEDLREPAIGERAGAPAGDRRRRPYTPPRVALAGRLEEITLGSIGTFPESGGGFLRGT